MNNVEIGEKGKIKEKLALPDGYTEDGRLPVRELYKAYDRLVNEFGWERGDPIYTQILETPQGNLEFPIYVYRTPKQGPALWLFAGVHGEEPAGPMAIGREIDFLAGLGKKIPMVIFPLCNPSGYFRDWRYPNEFRDRKKGKSVGDMEWVLQDPKSSRPKARMKEPACEEAFHSARKIIALSEDYPPQISFNLHEDESLYLPYIYSQGLMGAKDQVARIVVRILKDSGLPVLMRGKTPQKEDIVHGIVNKVRDGSIDELMGEEFFIMQGKVYRKKDCFTVIVVETPTLDVELLQRVDADAEIIHQFRRFWKISNSFNTGGM